MKGEFLFEVVEIQVLQSFTIVGKEGFDLVDILINGFEKVHIFEPLITRLTSVMVLVTSN